MRITQNDLLHKLNAHVIAVVRERDEEYTCTCNNNLAAAWDLGEKNQGVKSLMNA
jgi:hypothetical protein